MDDDKHDDAATPDSSRKRAPPTIDLTATSVSDSGAPNDAGASAASSGGAKPRKSWRDRLRAARASMTPSFRWRASTSAIKTPRPARAALSSMFVAGLTGAIVALLVLGAAWLFDSSGGSGRILARLPTTTAKSDRDATVKRVAKADPSTLTARLDALEKSVASLRDDVASARAAIDEIKSAPPPAVDTSAIDERIAKIERATVALTAEIASAPKPDGDDQRLRKIAIAATLDAAVNKGEPYTVALSAAKSAAEDASVLKPLDEFADKGIPSAASLNRELLTLLPQLTPKPAESAQPSGLLDRLKQSAIKLVRIRRADDVETANIAARATNAAQLGDLAAARRDVEPLTGRDRAPLASWIDKVDAREAALAASRQFVSGAAAALPAPAQ